MTTINYNYFFMIIPISLLFLNIFKIILNVNLLNFVILNYIFFSIFEFIAHKYIMHCDKNSLLTKIIKNIPFVNEEYISTCDYHIEHHIEVNPDMTLNENKRKDSLFMGWNTYIFIFFITLLSVFISKNISMYIISYKNIFIISIILSFIWSYIWNKVHIKMHKMNLDYSIKEGPYDENLLDLDIIKNLLLVNHMNHHLQKGDKKGNYNVIVLGADEWFGYNNKTVDNKEYCKTHINEQICK